MSTAQLVTALREVQVASVDLDGTITARDARRVLIGAAQAAGVRVRVARSSNPNGEAMVAHVLAPEDADAQARRAAVQRACRSIGEAVDALKNSFPEGGEYDPDDDVADLLEIKGDLEASFLREGS
jgi:hypothetical protein